MTKVRVNLTVTEETLVHLKEIAGGERMMGAAIDVLVAEAWKTHDPKFVEARLERRMDELNERLSKVFRMADASKIWASISANSHAIDGLMSSVVEIRAMIGLEDEVYEGDRYE